MKICNIKTTSAGQFNFLFLFQMPANRWIELHKDNCKRHQAESTSLSFLEQKCLLFLHVRALFWCSSLRSLLHFGKLAVVFAASDRTQDNDTWKQSLTHACFKKPDDEELTSEVKSVDFSNLHISVIN